MIDYKARIQQQQSLFTQCRIRPTPGDGCQIIWCPNINGPIIGAWEGVIRTFPNCSDEQTKVWKDSELPEEPIRGLEITREEDLTFCNDFNFYIMDDCLAEIKVKLFARESDTCRLGVMAQIFSGVTKREYTSRKTRIIYSGGIALLV